MGEIDPRSAKAWADRLETVRAHGSSWDQAKLPSDRNALVYLVVDGLYSTSLGEGHWHTKLVDRPEGQDLSGQWCAFSYAGYGEHYKPVETAQTLDFLLVRWDDYLSKLRPGQRLLPVCFSLGGALALIGLRRRLITHPGEIAKFPAAVLVAPAHAPAPDLLDGYQQKLEAQELAAGVPATMLELCDPVGPFRKEAQDALRELPAIGVQLHVVFWPHDLLTPYIAGEAVGIDEAPVLSAALLGKERDAVKEHINLRDQELVTAAVFEALKQH